MVGCSQDCYSHHRGVGVVGADRVSGVLKVAVMVLLVGRGEGQEVRS